MHLIAGQNQPIEKRLQMAPDPDKGDNLDKNYKSIVGGMIYYEWPVYPTMLRAINESLRV